MKIKWKIIGELILAVIAVGVFYVIIAEAGKQQDHRIKNRINQDSSSTVAWYSGIKTGRAGLLRFYYRVNGKRYSLLESPLKYCNKNEIFELVYSKSDPSDAYVNFFKPLINGGMGEVDVAEAKTIGISSTYRMVDQVITYNYVYENKKYKGNLRYYNNPVLNKLK